MSKMANNNDNYLEELEKISKRVEKMPEWKKEGWAILEEKSYYCGSTKEYQSNKKTSSFNTDTKLNV